MKFRLSDKTKFILSMISVYTIAIGMVLGLPAVLIYSEVQAHKEYEVHRQVVATYNPVTVTDAQVQKYYIIVTGKTVKGNDIVIRYGKDDMFPIPRVGEKVWFEVNVVGNIGRVYPPSVIRE